MTEQIMLAAISGESLMWLVFWVIIVGLCYWLIDTAIGKLPLPPMFATVARVLLILGAVVFLINALLSVAGHGFIRW